MNGFERDKLQEELRDLLKELIQEQKATNIKLEQIKNNTNKV